MRYLLVLTIFVVTTLSCGKESSNVTSTETFRDVVISNKSGLPFEIVLVQNGNFIFDQQIYAGEIGGEPTNFFANTDSTLAFIVPDLAPGNYDVNIPLDPNNFIFSLQIEEEETQIENADSYINEFILELESDLEFEVTAEIETAKQQIASLSAEDKLITARFLQNNRQVLDSLNASINKYESLTQDPAKRKQFDCNTECLMAVAVEIVAGIILVESATVVGSIIGVALAIDAGQALVTGRQLYLVKKVKSVAEEILSTAWFPQIKAANLIGEKLHEVTLWFDAPEPKVANNPAMVAQQEYKLTISDIPYRTLNADDEISGSEIVRRFISLYTDAKNFAYGQFGIYLPDFNDDIVYEPLSDLSLLQLEENENNVRITKFEQFGNSFNVVFDHEEGYEFVLQQIPFELKVIIDIDDGFETNIPIALNPPYPIANDMVISFDHPYDRPSDSLNTTYADVIKITKNGYWPYGYINVIDNGTQPWYTFFPSSNYAARFNPLGWSNYRDEFKYKAVNISGESEEATITVLPNIPEPPVFSNLTVQCENIQGGAMVYIDFSFSDNDGYIDSTGRPLVVQSRNSEIGTGLDGGNIRYQFAVSRSTIDFLEGEYRLSQNLTGGSCFETEVDNILVIQELRLFALDYFGVRSNVINFDLVYYR